MPAFFIIYCRLRIPLGHLVAVGIMTTTGKVVGQLNMKRGLKSYFVARGQRIGQDHLYDINVNGVVFYRTGDIVYLKIQAVNVTSLIFTREIKFSLSI